MRTDGQTDMAKEIAFRNTSNALKTAVLYFASDSLILYLLFLELYLLFLISRPEPKDAQFRRPHCEHQLTDSKDSIFTVNRQDHWPR